MNKLLFLFMVLLSRPVWADHHLIFISQVIKLSDSSCAVELELSGDNQDGFQDSDLVEFNDEEIFNFSSIKESLNASGGANDAGDHVLATSSSFASENSVTADISFTDSHCANLTSETTVDLFIDGFNTVDTLNLSTAVSSFVSERAVTKTAANGNATLIDLSTDSVTVTNNGGSTDVIRASFDTTDSSDSDSDTESTSVRNGINSSCHLNAVGSFSENSGLLFVIFGVLVLFLKRRFYFK